MGQEYGPSHKDYFSSHTSPGIDVVNSDDPDNRDTHSASPPGKHVHGQPRSRLWKLVECLLWVGIAVLAVLYLPSTIGGRVLFSPETLDTKSQSESLLIGTEMPVYRSRYECRRYKLVDYLISQGYWRPDPVENPRWMLVYRWNQRWKGGYSLLHRELAWRGDDWIEWSKAHVELAAAAWPSVLETLRSNRDSNMDQAVDILWLARESANVSEFRARLASLPNSEKMRAQ